MALRSVNTATPGNKLIWWKRRKNVSSHCMETKKWKFVKINEKLPDPTKIFKCLVIWSSKVCYCCSKRERKERGREGEKVHGSKSEGKHKWHIRIPAGNLWETPVLALTSPPRNGALEKMKFRKEMKSHQNEQNLLFFPETTKPLYVLGRECSEASELEANEAEDFQFQNEE